MKQHIPSKDYQGYTIPFPLFAEPDPAVLKDVSLGLEAFSEKHPEIYLFPDPFLPPDQLAPAALAADLQIVVGDSETNHNLAKKLQEAFQTTWKVTLPIVDGRTGTMKLPSTKPLILVGGAESHPVTMQIAKKYQLGLFSSLIPGPGGWGVTTHAALEDGAAPCFVISADPSQIETAVEFLVREAVDQPRNPTLRWIHHIVLGPTAQETLGTFADDLDKFRDDLLAPWVNGKFRQPYREALVAALNQDFPEGLVYNAVVVDLPMHALRHYQMTGDPGGLELFREMMWGIWNYLNGPDARIYISDIDFRLGLLLNYWSWIRHHPAITPEERTVFPKTLLGLTRLVRDYYVNLWQKDALSHRAINHVTFKTRSLLLAARHFRNRIPREAAEFQALAEEAFAARDLAASKHAENAAGYETFMPEHLLFWREVNGLGVPPEMQQSLAIFALRDWATLDNFLFLVDYGDCDPVLKRHRPFEVAPWLEGDTAEQKLVRTLERSSADLFPPTIAPPFRGFTGLHHADPERRFSGPVGWMKIPLDHKFAMARPLAGPAAKQFDKLAWRSGWSPDSTYLALEGIGNESIAHSHNEANSILRLNLGGRIWLVNNGYGRSDDIKAAQARFQTRNRGPEDHNMLIVRSPETNAIVLPPPNALLLDSSDGPVPYSITEMPDYAGLSWRRHVFLLAQGVVVVDRVESLSDALTPAFELQWNVLGKVKAAKGGAVVEQDGVHLVFQHPATNSSQWQESSIAVWRRLITEGAYPHTKGMPSRCTLQPATPFTGQTSDPFFFVGGFWIANETVQTEMTWQANRRELQIKSPENLKPFKTTGDWGTLTSREGDATVTFR